MALISCRGVALQYENHIAVSDVSFEIEPGDYLCIVGENGSGKSTLLKGLLGLMEPRAGTILYGDGLHRSEIGYLPQQTPVQRDFPASVQEIVLSGCLAQRGMRPFYAQRERRRCLQSMQKLGIEALARCSYRDLSGGQQQRALLARALCATGKLLLLDEPVTGLDPLAAAEMYRLIREMNRRDGIAVVMVSHDIVSALENATKILHLDTGVAFFGPASEYRSSGAGKRLTGGIGDD